MEGVRPSAVIGSSQVLRLGHANSPCLERRRKSQNLWRLQSNDQSGSETGTIPHIEELFASLASGDLLQVRPLSRLSTDPAGRSITTLHMSQSAHTRLFEYQRLPFGVTSVPSIFQRVMENLLQGIPRVCIYIDDILVTGATKDEHLANLAQVLQKLERAGMRLTRDKCGFLLKSVSYLRHVISEEGLHTAESKVKAVVEAPDTRNISELR